MTWRACRSAIAADLARAGATTTPARLLALSRRPQSRALVVVRLGSLARESRANPVVRAVLWLAYRRMVLRRNIEIPFATRIGPGLHIRHHVGGILINQRAVLGRNVTLTNAVTIGGTKGRAWPVIGDDVTIGAGAVVLGGVEVGDGARIGANATVVADVAPGATAIGPVATTRPTRRRSTPRPPARRPRSERPLP